MGLWKTLGGFLLNRACKAKLEEIAKDASRGAKDASQALAKADASVAMVRELRKQMSACMAIDVGFKDTGKVIILSRVQGQDRVRIVNVKPEMSVHEYKNLIESLESMYGADPIYVDAAKVLAPVRGTG